MHDDVLPLTAWTMLLCLIGCLWAHVPIKRSIVICLVVPVVVFGCSPILYFAAGFVLVFVVYLFQFIEFDIEEYLFIIAFVMKSALIGFLAWIYFSDERLDYIRKVKSDKESQPEAGADLT